MTARGVSTDLSNIMQTHDCGFEFRSTSFNRAWMSSGVSEGLRFVWLRFRRFDLQEVPTRRSFEGCNAGGGYSGSSGAIMSCPMSGRHV